MRHRTLAIGALCFAFGTAICLPPARAADGEVLLTARLQQIVDGYLAQRAEIEHITGVALQVSLGEGSPVIAVSSGTDGRRPDPQPMNESTLFQIGSNTKGFTAALILKLEAAGRLSIDQTVGDWLPQYPAWKSVSIRSLLHMTSGIPSYEYTVAIAQKIASDIHRQFTPAELIAAVDPNQGSTLPPTTGWSYSNTDYILAGLIIEKASGMSYREALQTQILKPLRLRDTYYADGPYPHYVLNREPSGFFWNPVCPIDQPPPCPPSVLASLLGRNMRTNNLTWSRSGGGMVSSLGDLARWYRALFGGRVLPSPQLAEMIELVSTRTGLPIPDVTAAEPAAFSLGIGRFYNADLDGPYWAYVGEMLGTRVLIAYWPQYDLVITTAANSNPIEDNLGPGVLLPTFATLKNTGAIQGTVAAAAGGNDSAAAGPVGR